jgi:hypothetical protein
VLGASGHSTYVAAKYFDDGILVADAPYVDVPCVVEIDAPIPMYAAATTTGTGCGKALSRPTVNSSSTGWRTRSTQ